MAQTQLTVNSRRLNWKAGILGSLTGGLLFGIMMAIMNMLPMVAGLIGSKSSVAGFVVHMAISLIFGFTFTFVASTIKWDAIVTGMLYGVLLWVLFPFILMPILMGMSEMAFQFTSSSMMSLAGHLLYGLTTGIIYKLISK